MSVDATARIRADARRLRGDLGKAEALFKRTFGRIAGGIKGAIGGALSPLGVGAGVTGIALLAREVQDFSKSMAYLAVDAQKDTKWIAEWTDKINALSRETGVAREKILEGAAALVELEGGSKLTEERLIGLVKAHVATRAEMGDLSGLAFALNNAFYGGAASAEELQLAMGGLVAAGKEGTISLKNMQAILQVTAPTFRNMGLTGKEAADQLVAFLQVGRQFGEFGTPEEVETGFTRFMATLGSQRKMLKRFAGVDPWKKTKSGALEMKKPLEVIDELLSSNKFMKRKDLWKTIFGSIEGKKFFEAVVAGRASIDDFANAAANAGDVIEKDFTFIQEQAFTKVEKAMNEAKHALLEAFTPERIKKFADALEKGANAVAWMVDHSTELIALWAAFKIGGVAVEFGRIASSLASASQSAAGLAGGMGAAAGGASRLVTGLTAAGGVLSALGFGVAVGTALDQSLGLSDKLSGSMAGIKGGSHKKGGGHTAASSVAGLKLDGDAEAMLAAAHGGTLSEKNRRRAGRVLSMAGAEGFLNAEGTGALSGAQIEEALLKRGMLPHRARKESFEIVDAIAKAFQIREAEFEKRNQVDVVITVDQRGLITAKRADSVDSRRSPQ